MSAQTIQYDPPHQAHPAVAALLPDTLLSVDERFQQRARIANAIASQVPNVRCLIDNEALAPFETDALIGYKAVPLAVVMPENELQALQALRALIALNIPIVGRGAGTGISGGSIPHVDGVLFVMTKMRSMHSLDALARLTTVEPGHRNLAVSERAAAHGLFYAPDPSSQIISSIGGNVAENAGGVHCLKYGFTTHNVQSVNLIDGDGALLHLGSKALDSAGFDLLSLAIGSEGCLGIVTEATLKLLPLPENTVTLLASFPSVDEAANAVGDIIGTGILPAALEMMDSVVIEACERFMQAGFPTNAKALLLCELDGEVTSVANDLARVQTLLNSAGAFETRIAKDDTERAKLWKSRKGAFAALATIKPDYYTIDGTIPRRSLPEVLRQTEAMAKEAGLLVANVFHAGDGNIHPCIFYDSSVPGDIEKSEALGARILELCVAVGGTITGEHGVGVEKLKQMCVQFRNAEIEMFLAVKKAFDPNDLMNPGKAVPTPKRCAEWGGMHVHHGRLPFPDVPRF